MKNRMFLASGLAVLGLFAGACQLDVERNTDGSLQIEAVISEADIANEIALGMQAEEGNVTVDLRNGYALIEATGPTQDNPFTESVSFRMELFVVDGHLGAEVSNAKWNDIDIPPAMVEVWNEELAKELEEGAKEDPDSTLVAVEIKNKELRFEFRHETEQSKG